MIRNFTSFRRTTTALAKVFPVVIAACASASPAASSPPGAASSEPKDARRETGGVQRPAENPSERGAPRAGEGSTEAPKKGLTIAEARRYMVQLINRDRASQKLPPVELDEGAPTRAGQAHAEDMAHLGYLGHWGSDGSVPESRHTDMGGADMVLENALCFTDEKARLLDPDPRIDPAEIERAEALFFNEVPPNDGHRKNILKAEHTHVGVGIAQTKPTATELAVACFTHEFTDHYGTYVELPKRTKVGATVHVEGTLAKGAVPTGVGIARVASPRPLPPSELNKRRSYPVPKPYQMYWKAGFVTPKPVMVDGSHFSIDVSLSEHGQPGLYEISVWAQLGGSKEHALVGLRTIRVD